MNHIAPRDEIEKVREIIARHHLPAFVKDYHVRLGEFDGTKGFWVTFAVVPNVDMSENGIHERGRELVTLTNMLNRNFFDEIEDRFPFYRFTEVVQDAAAE